MLDVLGRYSDSDPLDARTSIHIKRAVDLCPNDRITLIVEGPIDILINPI